MSVNEQRPSADTNPQSASQSFASDLEALDQRLKRLSDDVLPLHPYLLTLPTNAPFRLGGRFVDNWAVGQDRPFSLEEEQLQYMTFLTHHDADSLLVTVGDWSDETGRMMADRSTVPSFTNNSRDKATKKKISLKDYKSQKSSGAVARHEPGSRGGTSLAKPEDVQHNPGAMKKNNNETPQMSSKSPPRHSIEKGGQKRPSGSDLELRISHGRKEAGVHSPKKPRLSPEKETRREVIPSKSHSPRLPALLSPTLPPTSGGPKLPRLLSPTLPPDIEKELARLEDRSPIRNLSPERDSTTGKSRRDEPVQSKAPHLANSGSSNSSGRASGTDQALSNKDSNSYAKPTKSQHIVKLRYGKTNRRRVEALLKFSGKRKALQSDSAGIDMNREGSSHLKRKEEIGLASRDALSGRARNKNKTETDEALGPADGRSKEPRIAIEKPRTPVSHSPAHEKIKATSTTPMKEPKGSASRRNEIGDSDDKTPSHSANKRLSVDPGTGTKLFPSQPDSRSRNNERRAWRDDYQRFGNIGRELKHAAERYTSTNGASVTDEKLAAVTAIEAILCFILAFVADDQSKVVARQVGDSSTWLSILAYWRVVKKKSAAYPALHSLCSILGAVSYDAIHALDLERLTISPLPGEPTPVPTPGSDGNTVSLDESKRSRKEIVELKNRLLECYKDSQKLWLEGTRSLSEEILSQEFPNTWAGRSRSYSERGKPPLKPGEYSGDYFLPLGGPILPVEVVRFAWFLLKEWCTKEGVLWNGRLGL
ncbi:hypothetical protein NUU61_002496 [Penicillium alfredii]|uniref:Ell binding protein Ebp1 C-terminal domain-containing protein n=1 Tax=Penicillium alfredii TaxID=1506179 RepID=A0A9W9KG13_9EURO|nr:uncharacterized protein NUU61_002496 [Penicillium alfredii]KAJ5105149.1 hypothetical protein NUU61_002496 [Penicillium alfredii]